MPSDGFLAWRDYVASTPDLDIARLMRRSAPGSTVQEAAAYAAPFPDARYKAGVRTFPQLVPIAPDDPGAPACRRAAEWWATEWQGPSFTAVGVLGPPVTELVRRAVRDCPEPLLLEDAGHFVQERGDVVARAALEAFGD